MTERTYETGGEVLRIGSTVVVFDGNTVRRLKVTEIGTKRIFIESATSHRPVPYSKEDRKSQQGAYVSYFRTETEVAADQRRAVLKSKLRDLGIEARMKGGGEDGLSIYSNLVLEQLVEYLSDQAERAKKTQSQGR